VVTIAISETQTKTATTVNPQTTSFCQHNSLHLLGKFLKEAAG